MVIFYDSRLYIADIFDISEFDRMGTDSRYNFVLATAILIEDIYKFYQKHYLAHLYLYKKDSPDYNMTN